MTKTSVLTLVFSVLAIENYKMQLIFLAKKRFKYIFFICTLYITDVRAICCLCDIYNISSLC